MYPGTAIPTDHKLPESPKEAEMRYIHLQNKCHIWNNRRTNKDELKQRNQVETVSIKPTEWAEGECVLNNYKLDQDGSVHR